jgi:protein-S-isoprenylcysteine O-methyltransferase Ste14
MIESIVVTVFPVLFLTILFGSGEKFRRRNIDIDGEPPINRTFFYTSKYLILLVWLAMMVRGWGIILPIEISQTLRWLSLILWIAGFVLLLIGRFGLGDSFRIGSPKEATNLKMDGLFRLSRNPMYVGVYSTLLASFLYALNPLLLCVAIFIIVVHHKIVLAEEENLRKVFGQEYLEYCARVRRYL